METSEGVEAEALERRIGFGRTLRTRGLAVGTGRILTFCRAAAALGALDREDLYWAGRASLISRPEDAEAFDAAFDACFRDGIRIELNLPTSAPQEALGERDVPDGGQPDGIGTDERPLASRWSRAAEDEDPEGEAAVRIVASA